MFFIITILLHIKKYKISSPLRLRQNKVNAEYLHTRRQVRGKQKPFDSAAGISEAQVKDFNELFYNISPKLSKFRASIRD